MKVAVVDVGFNSLKMVKYNVEPGGTARSYGQLGVMAKLGEGLEKAGFLLEEPMSRTIDALKLCAETASLESIKHTLLIGTSPVREAANREEFLRRVQAETGLRMRVITGNEEALYGFVGAAKSVGAPTALFFDLGGGSLELTYAEKYRIKRIASLPLGALKLTDMYVSKDGRFPRKERGKMTKRIQQLLPSRRELGLDKDAVLVGTGGTVRAMARFHQDDIDYPLSKVHNYSIDSDAVDRMSREFLKLEIDELSKIEAIGEDRAETIAAGALVVKMLMKRLGFDQLIVSTHGLRDGILAEFLNKAMRASDGIAQKEEIERLLAHSEVPAPVNGSSELANVLVRRGIFDPRQESILLAAMERGRAPDCAEVNPDALFGILMSEDLPMSHTDQLFMAISLVRARRSRTANWLLRRFGDLLSRDDAKSVRMMGSCLRLMEILDRASAQFRVSYTGGLRINVVGSDAPFPLELARTAAMGLSAAIKTPVVVAGPKEREHHAGLLKAGA